MLLLTEGSTTDHIVVTLTEKTTIPNAHYLFVFEQVLSKALVKFVAGIDLSAYPERFNEFAVNTSVLFSLVGGYVYKVYEQVSAINTDPTGLTEVENGQAIVKSATDETLASSPKYSPSTSYKAYAG